MYDKQALLRIVQTNILLAIRAGDLPRPRKAKPPDTVCGPRSGIVKINAGMDNGVILKALVADDKNKARNLFPIQWLENQVPNVYLSGHSCCIEALWPRDMQVKRQNLSELGQHPQTPGKFILGQNERGITITMTFDAPMNQNMLLAGITRSGKTTTVTSILAQLARNGGNAEQQPGFVICDGKGDLSHLDSLRGLVGPYANSQDDILAALAWVREEIRRRGQYGRGANHAPLYVLWDEPQEILLNDNGAAKLFFEIVSQCLAFNIYIIFSPQSPKQELFSISMTRGQFGTSIVHLVRDRHESEAAIGDTEPRADKLSMQGDAYVVAPGGLCERVLVAYPDNALVDSVLGSEPQMDAWPMSYADVKSAPTITPKQAAAALWVSMRDQMSRGNLRSAMDRLGATFSNRDYGILKAFGSDMLEAYNKLGV